jgi:pimeloyl-ACP methyl ester carboxylesterase
VTHLRALTRLAFDELALGTGGIGEVHLAIADRAFPAGPAKLLHDGISGAVYAGLRGGAALAGRTAHTLLPDREVSPALLAILNGLRGDVLEPPLAIPMTLSVEGAETPRLAIFVHGLFETEHAWRYGGGPRYGDRLPGWTPVYVRYNTGRSVSENGRELADRIEALVAERDVEEVALIGHSMGGLVACSACHAGGDWSRLVSHVVTLGSPHTGAPLESAVHHAAEALGIMPESRAFASLLRRRSAGIRDLRRGLEVPLLENARHCFVSATVTSQKDHPVARVVGDWLVLESSASHRTQEPFHVGSAHHLALLNHPAVYERLAAQLG